MSGFTKDQKAHVFELVDLLESHDSQGYLAHRAAIERQYDEETVTAMIQLVIDLYMMPGKHEEEMPLTPQEEIERNRHEWGAELSDTFNEMLKRLIALYVDDYRFQRQVRKLDVDAAMMEVVAHIDAFCADLRQQLSLEVSNAIAAEGAY